MPNTPTVERIEGQEYRSRSRHHAGASSLNKPHHTSVRLEDVDAADRLWFGHRGSRIGRNGMEFVWNSSVRNHRQVIGTLFEDAEEILISVAFLKMQGLTGIEGALRACLKTGGSVRLHVGQDFFLTEPEALTRLLKLSERERRCGVFLASKSAATFHPKVYVARNRNGSTAALVGSANLTGGALTRNVEVSVLMQGSEAEPMAGELGCWFGLMEAEGRVVLLDRLALIRYRTAWESAQAARQQFEEAQKTAATVEIDVAHLREVYERYRASDEFRDLALRQRTRLEAMKHQNKIADAQTRRLDRVTASQVQTHLKHLMGSKGHEHLWHSDSIFRRGSKALQDPRALTRVFATAREALSHSPSEAYEAVRSAALKAPGVGVNMITEILSTFSPKRFPVFNGNTAGALAALGVSAKPPSTKQAFRGRHYGLVTEAVAAVRDRIGAVDFQAADSFLNYIYWHEL